MQWLHLVAMAELLDLASRLELVMNLRGIDGALYGLIPVKDHRHCVEHKRTVPHVREANVGGYDEPESAGDA